MEFEEAVSYLYSLIDYEKKKGYVSSLEPFFEFLSQFDNPHKRIKNPILIVGTKGKGSVAHLIAGGLQSIGFKVGLYTSPHLVDIRERIRINGVKIPEKTFVEYLEKIKPKIEGKRGIRTVFETLTLMAFLYFLEEKVDYAVLEAGLGGRLDATNSVNQILTVITNIGYDHREILGNKLTQIAFEKASVIKNNNPVVVAKQHPSVYKVIDKLANERGAPLFKLKDYTTYKIWEAQIDRLKIIYTGLYGEKLFTLNQGGLYQGKNMALSSLSLEALGYKDFNYENVTLEGRFEIVSKDPLIIVDGAHNAPAVSNLLKTAKTLLGRDCIFVFGINKDKEVESVISKIIKVNPAYIILTRSKSPRASEPEVLYNIFMSMGFDGKAITCAVDVKESLKKALSYGNKILVFGSFYLAGEVKEILNSDNARLTLTNQKP